MADSLTHYIVVRRDLPFGVLLAMVAHAAGESFYKLACLRSSEKERPTFSREDVGSIPTGGSPFDPSQTIAIVLGARNVARLGWLCMKLDVMAIPYSVITETDGEFAGQLMAIGVVPTDRADVRKIVNEFQLYRAFEGTVTR